MDDIRPAKPRQPDQPNPPSRPPAILPRPGGSPEPKDLSPDHDSVNHPTGPPRKKWPWIIGIILAVLIVAGVVIGFMSWQWYNDALRPRSSVEKRVRITVSSGETAETIGKELQDKDVIKNSFAFSLYLKQTGKYNQIKAGAYLFSPTQSVSEIVDWLVQGKVDSYNLTILPGKTLADIKKSLQSTGYQATEIDAAFAKTYMHPLLKDKPATVNLEGYIFPETYQINSETTVEQLLTRAFDEFYKRLQVKNIPAQLAAHGFNLHQGVTLASLVQLEVSKDAERRQVAQVFEKRLKQGMPLGSDVTFLYAAKLLGETPTINVDSPYNTRLHTGLPPGAIANFNLASIEAVAGPAPGDYLYFVAGDDGVTHFARTEAEHNQNVQQYCTKLCQ